MHIARNLGDNLIHAKSKRFHDGELQVFLDGPIDGDTVTIVHSISNPVNDNLMELLLMVDAAKRTGAKHIIAIIPYIAYARQDRLTRNGSALPISLIAKLLETSGVTKIITLDIHSDAALEVFSMPIINLPMIGFNELNKYDIMVAPDEGARLRAIGLAEKFGKEYAIISKSRIQNECIAVNITGDVRGKKCIIVDDIIDSGKTIRAASNLLIHHGAKSVDAYVSHGVFGPHSGFALLDAEIDKLYITDSILSKEAISNEFKYFSKIVRVVESSAALGSHCKPVIPAKAGIQENCS